MITPLLLPLITVCKYERKNNKNKKREGNEA
jgi:hypothetical protein